MPDMLTAADRCDRCGARAYVRIEMDAADLLFCAHHARVHVTKLRDLGATIHDETGCLALTTPRSE